MTKWEYLNLISKRGTHYGANGGVLDLLKWCNKPNTASVTKKEAMAFWKMQCEKADIKPDAE